MALPPAWKIRRELFSAQDQLKAWGLQLLSPIYRIIYDQRELTKIKIYDGARELQEKLVLYLVFQPKGLVESNFVAIEDIVAAGHEVMVISNATLPSADLMRLRPICWRILERENLGYDFGGYRCGLHYLKQQKIYIDILTLINDSIWFPVIPDSNLLSKTERLISDFGGAVCLNSTDRVNQKMALSYWLTLRAPLLSSSAFWDYWQNYIPTKNKTLTVKHGERGISRHMQKSGRKIDGIYTLENFLLVMRRVSTHELQLTLEYAAFTDHIFQSECNQLLETAEDSFAWRDSCLNFIERVSKKRNFLNSFCYAAAKILRVPFIKKNKLQLQVLMRKQYLRAVFAGDLPPPKTAILNEIQESIGVTNLADL